MLALNIYETFYTRTGWEGAGQAKAVVFFIIVAVIAMLQNRLTRRVNNIRNFFERKLSKWQKKIVKNLILRLVR